MFGGVGEIISKYIPMYIRVSTSFDLVKSLNILRYHTWVKGKSENIKIVFKKNKGSSRRKGLAMLLFMQKAASVCEILQRGF